MSLETWKQEFYPVTAAKCAKGATEAILHSIKKWEGLTPENLEKHGVTAAAWSIDGFNAKGARVSEMIGSDSCALCKQFYKKGGACRSCPLCAVRGDVGCDSERGDEKVSPWAAWTDELDPQPMLMWLRKAADANTPI